MNTVCFGMGKLVLYFGEKCTIALDKWSIDQHIYGKMKLIEIQQLIGKKFVGKQFIEKILLEKKYGKILLLIFFKMPLPFLGGRNKNNTVICQFNLLVVQYKLAIAFFEEYYFKKIGIERYFFKVRSVCTFQMDNIQEKIYTAVRFMKFISLHPNQHAMIRSQQFTKFRLNGIGFFVVYLSKWYDKGLVWYPLPL